MQTGEAGERRGPGEQGEREYSAGKSETRADSQESSNSGEQSEPIPAPTLRFTSSQKWLDTVLENFDDFLPDHAAAEKKASSMAMSMVAHYPDKPNIVHSMAELAVEELSHFREVAKIIYARGLQLRGDTRDQYVIRLRAHIRQGPALYLLDRLLVAGIIEARGAERFGLIAEALPPGSLKSFYQSITRSEQRHQNLFTDLACEFFPQPEVEQRLDELLDAEANIAAALPIAASLH